MSREEFVKRMQDLQRRISDIQRKVRLAMNPAPRSGDYVRYNLEDLVGQLTVLSAELMRMQVAIVGR